MANRWQSVNPKDSNLTEALKLVQRKTDPTFTALITILDLTKTLVEYTSALLTELPDLATVALKAGIAVVRALLSDFTGEGGFYFLAVPMSPIDRAIEDKITFEEEPGANTFTPTEGIIPIAVKKNLIGSGGNYGFLSTVAKSLNDQEDPMRPKFSNDAHVAAVVIVIGADVMINVAVLINKLASLFSGPEKTGLSEAIKGGNTLPHPKNLRAEIVPGKDVSAQGEYLKNYVSPDGVKSSYAVKLSWDIESEYHILPWPNANGTAYQRWKIAQVRVYRSDKPISTSYDKAALEKIRIADYDFDSWLTDFYDDGVEFGTTWNYAVGFKMVQELVDDNGDPYDVDAYDSVQPFEIRTTQITLPEDPNMFARKGVPPDWFVVPSPLAMIPAITRVVDRITTLLDALEDSIESKSDATKKYIKAIEDEINGYIDWTTDLVNTIDQLINALNWEGVYAGATVFSGKGGNNFFLNQLGTALMDTADTSRPPFLKGDEATCGFIMYAGAETVGKIQKFMSLTELLLGVSFGNVVEIGQSAADTYNAALAAIDAAIGETDTRLGMTDDLLQKIELPAAEPILPAFNSSMQPSKEAEGCE